LWAAAALLAVLAPAVASGQEPPPETPPPGTIVYGPLTLTPSLSFKDVGLDDNVFNDAVDPKSDFTFTVTPRANVGFRVRRLHVGLITALDYVYYNTYDSERGTNLSSEVRVDVDLGRLRPYATFAGNDTRNRPNAEVDTRARHHDTAYAGGFSLRVASRTNLLMSARRAMVEYDPDEQFRGESLAESFNGTVDRIEGGVGIDVTPITTLSVLYQHEEQQFDLSPSRSSNSWRLWPTLTFSPTGLLTGNASVGFRSFDPVDPTVPDFSGLVASVAIGATIYGRHQLQAAYVRDVQYSYDPATPYYVTNGGNLTWTTVVAGPFDVRGLFGRTRMDYRGLAGVDTQTSYGGGMGYRLSDYARLGVNIEWITRDSEISPNREYRNRRIFASLTWGST
jgi:hypothetical protein